MNNQYNIEKPPVPKGMSYVLKTSEIQATFNSLKVELPIYVRYYAKSIPSVFECKFLMPSGFDSKYRNANTNPRYKRIFVYLSCVDYKVKDDVNPQVVDILNTSFSGWLSAIIALPDNSTYFNREMYFCIIFENDIVITKYTPEF